MRGIHLGLSGLRAFMRAVAAFSVKSSVGTAYAVPRIVRSSTGTPYTVPGAVLSSGGTSYNAI